LKSFLIIFATKTVGRTIFWRKKHDIVFSKSDRLYKSCLPAHLFTRRTRKDVSDAIRIGFCVFYIERERRCRVLVRPTAEYNTVVYHIYQRD
jgi:hypothetical protein